MSKDRYATALGSARVAALSLGVRGDTNPVALGYRNTLFAALRFVRTLGDRLVARAPRKVHDGECDRRMVILRDPTQRERLRREMTAPSGSWMDMWLTNLHARHHRFEGRSIAEVAERMDKDPVAAICVLLVAEDLQVSSIAAGAAISRCSPRS
jgi:N-acyl-D-aspartate/D-glutamate deacylase